MIKKLIIILSGIMIAGAGILLTYDLLVFNDFYEYLKLSLSNSPLSQKGPPENLKEIAYLVYGKDRVNTYMVQTALPGHLKRYPNNLPWKWNYLLSSILVTLHFNENEILILWCDYVPYEMGWGLNKAAQFKSLFKTPHKSSIKSMK